jgi:hypothetical protein
MEHALDSEKFTLNGEGRDLIPYTLTFEATAFNQRRGSIPGKNIYKVKVRASLTTSIGNEDIFTETADKIITVTVEGLRITTADFSIPENHSDAIMLTTNQDFNENADVIFGNRNSDGFGGGFACVISTSSNLHRVDVIFSGFKVSGIKVKHIIILAIKAKFIYICATRPYTLTLKATASAQKKPYQVKVRATLTTFKTLLQDEFIETADKIINVTVEGLRITTLHRLGR